MSSSTPLVRSCFIVQRGAVLPRDRSLSTDRPLETIIVDLRQISVFQLVGQIKLYVGGNDL